MLVFDHDFDQFTRDLLADFQRLVRIRVGTDNDGFDPVVWPIETLTQQVSSALLNYDPGFEVESG